MGMGLTEGTPIPEYRGNQRIGYKRDINGNTVTTHLDEATLTAIAHAGKGIYVRATNTGAGVQEIVRLIEGMEKDRPSSPNTRAATSIPLPQHWFASLPSCSYLNAATRKSTSRKYCATANELL